MLSFPRQEIVVKLRGWSKCISQNATDEPAMSQRWASDERSIPSLIPLTAGNEMKALGWSESLLVSH